MAINEFGVKLDKNGYAPSILQNVEDQCRCYLCRRVGSSWRKQDRHEVRLGGISREEAKGLGLWCMLCHDDCHEGPNGVHLNREVGLWLKRQAQRASMRYYGWTEDDFRQRFGKSYLPLDENREDTGKC